MLNIIVRQPHLKLHPNHVRIRLPPRLRATGKSTSQDLLTAGFTITFSAFCFLTQPPHVSAIEVDRGQLERILSREFETRVHRASDAELLKLLQQLSVPQSLDFSAPEESSSVLQSITKPIKKQDINLPKEQDINPVKEQEIDESENQDQNLFDDLTFQMQDLKQKKQNFGLDVNQLQKALRYALASGIAISVFLFGLKSAVTQEQDSTETSGEETEPVSEQQEEDQTSEDQTPTDGVLWRRSGVQTDSIEEQSFEVEWQDEYVVGKQDQDREAGSKQEIIEDQKQDQEQDLVKAQKQDAVETQEQDLVETQEQDLVELQKQDQEQDLVEVQKQDQEQDLVEVQKQDQEQDSVEALKQDQEQDLVEVQKQDQEQDSVEALKQDSEEVQEQDQEEEIMISPPLPRRNWKASEILSNVDSNHSATLLPNILRLSKRY